MTLERAAELVAALRNRENCNAEDLFSHFVDYFNLGGAEQLENFASMCGYMIARNVRIL